MTVLHWEWPPWRSFMVLHHEAVIRLENALQESQSKAAVQEINNARDEALEALERHRETQRPPQDSRPA